MKRRDLLKSVLFAPFAGLLKGKSNQLPSVQDVAHAKLWECADYATMTSPFVQHNGIWFFADQNIIKYCSKNKLRWDNWESIQIEEYDSFDFWQLDKGKLYWCGEYKRWELLTQPVRIQLDGVYDNY